MVVSIRNTASVRCSVGVRFSEGPLWEIPLYTPYCVIVRGGSLAMGKAEVRDYLCVGVNMGL